MVRAGCVFVASIHRLGHECQDLWVYWHCLCLYNDHITLKGGLDGTVSVSVYTMTTLLWREDCLCLHNDHITLKGRLSLSLSTQWPHYFEGKTVSVSVCTMTALLWREDCLCLCLHNDHITLKGGLSLSLSIQWPHYFEGRTVSVSVYTMTTLLWREDCLCLCLCLYNDHITLKEDCLCLCLYNDHITLKERLSLSLSVQWPHYFEGRTVSVSVYTMTTLLWRKDCLCLCLYNDHVTLKRSPSANGLQEALGVCRDSIRLHTVHCLPDWGHNKLYTADQTGYITHCTLLTRLGT